MYESNGKNYARVSDILKPLYDFSNIPSFILERKANIGTNVHAAIASDINGEFPIASDCEIGYLNSYYEWKRVFKPNFVQTEQRYFCDEKMITGQIDALILLTFQGIPTLVDFKTSVKESKEVWPLQACLYSYLLKKNGIEHQNRYHFVKLEKTGKLADVFIYEFTQEIEDKCIDLIDKFWKDEKNTSHK